jgi:hypothetical protein
MTAREVEDELEVFMRRRALLRTHLSTLERLEPPAELDRLVLKAARLAIQPPVAAPSPAKPRRRRWAVPAGVAATVALSMTLLVDVAFHNLPPTDQTEQPTAHISRQPVDVDHTDEVITPDGAGSHFAYPRLAANGSAPIFEVVIRSRLAPISASRSSEPSTR